MKLKPFIFILKPFSKILFYLGIAFIISYLIFKVGYCMTGKFSFSFSCFTSGIGIIAVEEGYLITK